MTKRCTLHRIQTLPWALLTLGAISCGDDSESSMSGGDGSVNDGGGVEITDTGRSEDSGEDPEQDPRDANDASDGATTISLDAAVGQGDAQLGADSSSNDPADSGGDSATTPDGSTISNGERDLGTNDCGATGTPFAVETRLGTADVRMGPAGGYIDFGNALLVVPRCTFMAEYSMSIIDWAAAPPTPLPAAAGAARAAVFGALVSGSVAPPPMLPRTIRFTFRDVADPGGTVGRTGLDYAVTPTVVVGSNVVIQLSKPFTTGYFAITED